MQYQQKQKQNNKTGGYAISIHLLLFIYYLFNYIIIIIIIIITVLQKIFVFTLRHAQVAFALGNSWLYMVEIRRKCLLYQCFLCDCDAFSPVRMEAKRGLRPYGSGGCWAMRLHSGRVETISTSSGATKQKTSSITEPERQAQVRIVIVESERLKLGLVRCGGISLWAKQKPCLKRKKSALNEKWQSENSRTQSERAFPVGSGRLRPLQQSQGGTPGQKKPPMIRAVGGESECIIG